MLISLKKFNETLQPIDRTALPHALEKEAVKNFFHKPESVKCRMVRK